jgi:hypothetical protein
MRCQWYHMHRACGTNDTACTMHAVSMTPHAFKKIEYLREFEKALAPLIRSPGRMFWWKISWHCPFKTFTSFYNIFTSYILESILRRSCRSFFFPGTADKYTALQCKFKYCIIVQYIFRTYERCWKFLDTNLLFFKQVGHKVCYYYSFLQNKNTKDYTNYIFVKKIWYGVVVCGHRNIYEYIRRLSIKGKYVLCKYVKWRSSSSPINTLPPPYPSAYRNMTIWIPATSTT